MDLHIYHFRITDGPRPTLPWATASWWCRSLCSSSSSPTSSTRPWRSPSLPPPPLSSSPSLRLSSPALAQEVKNVDSCTEPIFSKCHFRRKSILVWPEKASLPVSLLGVSLSATLWWVSHDRCIPELESTVLFPGNVSYSLYTHGNNNNNNRETHRMTDTEIVDIYPSEVEFFNIIL